MVNAYSRYRNFECHNRGLDMWSGWNNKLMHNFSAVNLLQCDILKTEKEIGW